MLCPWFNKNNLIDSKLRMADNRSKLLQRIHHHPYSNCRISQGKICNRNHRLDTGSHICLRVHSCPAKCANGHIIRHLKYSAVMALRAAVQFPNSAHQTSPSLRNLSINSRINNLSSLVNDEYLNNSM